MPRLSDDDVRTALTDGLPGWTYDGAAIEKAFVFKGFMAAIGFIDRLALEAQAARHHPDLENHYNRVLVSLSTHDEGGVTELDVALARAIEAVAEPPEA
jgi:4a-hydroxytetrahydrobiopterin dehydratase